MSEEEYQKCEECQSTDFKTRTDKDGITIVKCNSCGKEYTIFESDEAFEKYIKKKMFERFS